MQTVMKKIFMILAAALLTVSMSAADLTGKRIYVNPGHGSFGPNDRPRATLQYPNLPTTGMPDTCGFYESNTNLWKCMYLGAKLEAAGATVLYSRTECGPWPYEMKNGDYPDYKYIKDGTIKDPTLGWQFSDGYQAHPDYEKYNRNLVEISAEVEANNIDYFISVHSNANSEGDNVNYPIFLFRGPTAYSSANSTDGYEYVEGSYEKAYMSCEEKVKIMKAGIEVASKTSVDVRGDWTFYGSHSDRTHANGKKYSGYLGALKHGASGFLSEGYFHTYQPGRHRAMNPDYCHMEGLDYYRGIIRYYGADAETKGYIVGTVKDAHNKMNNSLYNYIPKSNDQWVPCNGAEVILKKAGVEVARYVVDQNYNGIFVFKDLEPGDDYTLDATCQGYHPLDQEQKVALTVKANETTYPKIFLTDTAYVEEEITVVYTNYPDPEQPAYVGVPGIFEMVQSYVDKPMDELLAGKTIRRVLYRDGLMYVLAIDADKNPTLAVANEYGVVEAELPTDFCTVKGAEGLKLSDIAFTAEGVLVGCNKEAVSFTPSNKWNLYKWEKTAEGWKGALWLSHASNETAGNYTNAYVGNTFAYSGTLKEGTIAATTMTTGSSKAIRFVMYSIYEGLIDGAFRNQPNGVTEPIFGADMKMVVSPRDDKSFILSSSLTPAIEWQIVETTKAAPTIVGTMPFITHTPNYFKYAGKAMMVAPTVDAEGLNTGVAVYDITAGVDKAQLIKTTNTTLDPSEALYTAAFAQVKGTDLTLYLVNDAAISKFTTAGVDQPVVPAIGAYGLNVTYANDTYTFSYNANSDAKAAALVFYKDGVEAGRVAVDVKKGANTFELAADMLPGEDGDVFTWALDLTGDAIANWGVVHHTPLASLKADASTAMVRPFVAINNSPESDYFQHLYIVDRQGSGNAKSGLHAFTPDYSQINTAPLKGGRATYGSPYRTYVDDQGYIWISDGRDATSGIIVADPANLEGTYEEFFQFDNRTGAGLLTKGGVDVGSSSVGLSIYGTGKDAKLLTVNEDAGTWLKAMSLVIYNIGTEEGTYKHSWDGLPSAQIELQGMAAIDGYPLGCSHGVWIATRRTSGNNNASATALQFYDWNGTRQLSSAEAPYNELIDGCTSGAIALNEDESVLYMIDASKNLMVWDIVWEGDKPVMTLRYAYNCGLSSIREMHLDYAGNLVCSGDEGTGLIVLAIPSAENNTVVPAKKALTVAKVQGVPVTGMELSAETASVELDATLDLSELVVFTPADATNKMVTWKSEDETVATVDAAGVVTGLKLGTTKISATSMEGNYSDTLVLTVAPISVKGIKILSGDENGIMHIGLNAPYAIAYEITPANAANQNLTWESSDPSVAAIQNNQGLVIGYKDGVAIITVTTEDGGYQDFLTIYAGTYTSVEDVKNATGLDLNAPMYDVVGRQVDKNYRGIIIQNGNKYLLK